MTDYLLRALLRTSIVTMITASIVAGLTFLYSALFHLIGGRVEVVGARVALALGCAAAVYFLWRHRGDLTYS